MAEGIVLRDVFKGYTDDLDKAIAPGDTVTRFRERLKDIDLDILEETLRIDNGRLGIPVYFSVCGRDAEAVIGEKKQMGKGGTPEQAEASATMELAERFSLFSYYSRPENFIWASYEELEGRAMPLDMIARSVSAAPGDISDERMVFSGLRQKWTRGYDVRRGKEVLIPFDWFFSLNEYNGASAGNCIEEAILQGLCEVVERHVSSVISRKSMPVPGVDLASVSNPLARSLIRKYQDAGINLYISDFSLDTGIPTIGALAWDPSTFPEKSEIVWTAGTTTSPEKSFVRALTEVAQLGGDFNTGSNYIPSGLPKLQSMQEAAFVSEPADMVSISSLPDVSDPNIKTEIDTCIERIGRLGMDLFVVDVTHPILDIPAVYAIVPGAHFRERTEGTSMGMLSAKLIAGSHGPEDAINELQRLDKILPERYYIHFFIALSHISLGDHENALGYLEKSLSLGPSGEDLPTVYSYMGVCLKELERYREAISVLKKAEECDSERTDIYNLMGFSYFKLKEHEKAIGCFERVLAINPGSAIDYANMASNYRELGDTEKASRFYRIALELDPSIEFARENLKKLGG